MSTRKMLVPVEEYWICDQCDDAELNREFEPEDGFVPLGKVALDHFVRTHRTYIGEVFTYDCGACGRPVTGNVFHDAIEYELQEFEVSE